MPVTAARASGAAAKMDSTAALTAEKPAAAVPAEIMGTRVL